MTQPPRAGRQPERAGSIQIRLADDTVVSLEDDDVRPFCAALWTQTATPGAVGIVVALEHERRRNAVARVEIRLTEQETAVFRIAQASLL